MYILLPQRERAPRREGGTSLLAYIKGVGPYIAPMPLREGPPTGHPSHAVLDMPAVAESAIGSAPQAVTETARGGTAR